MDYKAISFISARGRSWSIFFRNFQDLYLACDELKKPDAVLYENNGIKTLVADNWDNKKDDIDRKLHNFLASAKTLVDHTRVLIKYLPEDIREQFNIRLKKVLECYPVVGFMHDLRNYSTHYKCPIDYCYIDHVFYIDEDIKHCYFHLKITKKSLFDYTRWNKESLKFIESLEAETDVQKLAVDYFDALSELNIWINQELPSSLPK